MWGGLVCGFFPAVVWEQLRWVERPAHGAGHSSLWQSSSLLPVRRQGAGSWWLEQGMQPVVPAFEPWQWSIPCNEGLPVSLARCSSALLRWRVRAPAVLGRARAGSSVAWGAARAVKAGEGQHGGGGQPAAHGESCRVMPVARGLVSVIKQHRST